MRIKFWMLRFRGFVYRENSGLEQFPYVAFLVRHITIIFGVVVLVRQMPRYNHMVSGASQCAEIHRDTPVRVKTEDRFGSYFRQQNVNSNMSPLRFNLSTYLEHASMNSDIVHQPAQLTISNSSFESSPHLW